MDSIFWFYNTLIQLNKQRRYRPDIHRIAHAACELIFNSINHENAFVKFVKIFKLKCIDSQFLVD